MLNKSKKRNMNEAEKWIKNADCFPFWLASSTLENRKNSNLFQRKPLNFGTGGFRELMRAGPNSFNEITIQHLTQGFTTLILKIFLQKFKIKE